MSIEKGNLEMFAHLLIPMWGTTQPVTLGDLGRPVYDTNWRPVQERKVLNIAGEEEVPFDYVFGLEDGERAHYPVNISAYKAILPVWDEALGISSHVRQMIMPYGSKVTAGGVESVLHTLNAIAVWQVFRSDLPTRNGGVRPDIGAVSKMARGGLAPYHLEHMKEDFGSPEAIREPVPLTTSSFMERVFRQGDSLVVGDRIPQEDPPQQACPAPRKKIEEFAHVIFDSPVANMGEMGRSLESLGIGRAELQRIRLFGTALGRAIILTDQIKKRKYGKLTPETALMQLNSLRRKLNETLNRGNPPTLFLPDILPTYSGAGFGMKGPTAAFSADI